MQGFVTAIYEIGTVGNFSPLCPHCSPPMTQASADLGGLKAAKLRPRLPLWRHPYPGTWRLSG